MARDIDYAATAVKTAMIEKYGRDGEMHDLSVIANDRTISVRHGGRTAEGTRDDLLAAIRSAATYAGLWQALPSFGKSIVAQDQPAE